MFRCIPIAAALLLACPARAEDAPARHLLRIGDNLPETTYRVEIAADQRVGDAPQRLEASYVATVRALGADQEGCFAVHIAFGEGDGYVTTGEARTRLEWSYEGASYLPVYGPDSVVREILDPLRPAGPAPTMDPLASYLGQAWWIALPQDRVSEGDAFLREVESEPGPTGEALVRRTVSGALNRVEEVEGRRVAFLWAEIDEVLLDEHPALSGSAQLEMDVALDLNTGALLAAVIREMSEVTVKTGPSAGLKVETTGLRCRVSLIDGPEVF